MAGSLADLINAQSAPPTPTGPSVAPIPEPPSGFVPADSGSPPPPPPGFVPAKTGVGENLKAGAVEGLTGTLGSIVDAVNPVNAVRGLAHDTVGLYHAVRQIAGAEPFDAKKAIADDQQFQASLNPTPHKLNRLVQAATGYNPENTVAATFPERLARGTAAGVTGSLVFPTGEGVTLANAIKTGLIGAGAGAGSTTAAEVAPENLKPLAGVVGGLFGGGAVGGAEAAAQAARSAPVPEVVRNMAAGFSPQAAETAAGRVLAKAASDPAAAQAALEQPGEIVPGSQPTAFQQSGDQGLGQLERAQAAKNPAPFNDRRAEQNNARVQALGTIQQGADPNDVSATLRQHLADLDAQTEARVNQQAQAAQGRAQQIGGHGTPEGYGEQIRGLAGDSEDAARAREGALWKAVDPNGDLTGNVSQTIQAAQDIAGSLPRAAKPMDGEEAGVFTAARELQPLSPVSELIALRSRVNDALAQELKTNGRTASYARLSQLRGAIQDNLANTISQAIANEQPLIERGVIEPSQSIAAKVQSEVDVWRAQRAATLAGGDGQAATAAPLGAAAVHGVPGAEGQAAEVAGGRTGGTAPSPGTPSFDEAASQRLAEATAATKDRARTYGLGPVGQILAKGSASDLYRLPEGQVPRKFFHPGPTAYSDLQALFKATGQDRAMPAVVDYAASSLRRAAMNEDGTLDPAKYERWRAAYTDALRALPADIKARFADAASASEALADARAARTATLKDAQAGAIGRVMNLTEPQDVTRTIGTVLNSRTAAADMKQLALATKGKPEARAGLRQAVADYMASKLIGNTEAGTSGVHQIKADAYQTFIKNARPALNLIFTPEEVRSMEAIAEDLQRANRSISATKLPGGSNSPQDFWATLKRAKVPGGHSLMNVLAAVAGEHQGGLVGAVALAGLTHFAQALHGAGAARIDGLVTQAMLNPKLAAELLKKVSAKPTPATFRPVAAALVKSIAPTNAATQPR